MWFSFMCYTHSPPSAPVAADGARKVSPVEVISFSSAQVFSRPLARDLKKSTLPSSPVKQLRDGTIWRSSSVKRPNTHTQTHTHRQTNRKNPTGTHSGSYADKQKPAHPFTRQTHCAYLFFVFFEKSLFTLFVWLSFNWENAERNIIMSHNEANVVWRWGETDRCCTRRQVMEKQRGSEKDGVFFFFFCH